jgi:GT2 family glycosyltransferase
MQPPTNPSILVLLVATDGATWLPDVLRGLRAQRYRPLEVICVDNASSDGSQKVLEKAFGVRRVVKLERRTGYGRALAAGLKVAAERNTPADAVLLLHDDCALKPDAIEAMARVLEAGSAGIVGAKLVEWDTPEILQDIGQTTDRYGRSVPRVERNEIDQGQHDGLHDVLFASSAALLIARPVLETVGLFDPRFVALRDDLDLCWRARMAGFRTLVTTDAVGRHAAALSRDLRESAVKGRTRYFGDRNMIATLIKNYSRANLLLALPVTFFVSLVNALIYLFRGRRDSALQSLEALQWNIAHLPSTLRARARAQRARTLKDAQVTNLMHHGATRLRAQLEGAMERVVGEVDEGPADDVYVEPPSLLTRLRAHPGGTMLGIAAVLAFINLRNLFGAGMLAGADVAPFPDGAGAFFHAFSSGWRGAASGGAGPATPALSILGLLSTVLFNSTWLAQRAIIIAPVLIAAFTMFRLTRNLGFAPGARRISVIAYAASPLMLASFGQGRFADAVLVAFAPLLVTPLLRAVWTVPDTGWRATASGIAWLALVTSLSPWALPFTAACGLILAMVLARGPKPVALPLLRRTAWMVAGALVLLFPWSVELFRAGSPLGAGGSDRLPTMVDLLGLRGGSLRVVPMVVSFGFVATAVAGAFAASERRRRSARLFLTLGVLGLAAAWAVSHGVPWIAPRSTLPLTATALGVALLAGVAFEAVGPALTARTFGKTHLVAGICGVLFALQVGGAAWWLVGAQHSGLVPSGALVPAFLSGSSSTEGAVRVLWVGGDVTSPAVAITSGDGAQMTDYLARPAGAGADALRHSIAQIAAGSTETGGRLLATLGIRYVIVRPEASPSLASAVGRQVDLSYSQDFRGALIYENRVGLGVAASVEAGGWLSAAAGDLDSAAGAGGSAGAGRGFVEVARGTFAGQTSSTGRTVLLAQDHSTDWRATSRGKQYRPFRSFGWATGFRLPSAGDVRIEWKGQRWHRGALVLQALLIAAFWIGCSQRAARERGER